MTHCNANCLRKMITLYCQIYWLTESREFLRFHRALSNLLQPNFKTSMRYGKRESVKGK